MTMHPVVMSTLRRALSIRRPCDSMEEGRFLLSLIPKGLEKYTWIDGGGNLHVDLRIRRQSGRYITKTLFVAHTDTVHHDGGDNYFSEKGNIWKAKGAQPLGADDGAGVAILAGLIAENKPGYYIFTRGEERGGIGSSWIAENMEDLLFHFDRAIAFDRRDTFSVITHQMMGRCCSDAFAEELCSRFNEGTHGLLYMPDDGGSFTDTANFTSIIPECTNISVGYMHEHSKKETLDIDHVARLFDAALELDWESLPVERDPDDEPEDKFSMYGNYGRASHTTRTTVGTKGTPTAITKDWGRDQQNESDAWLEENFDKYWGKAARVGKSMAEIEDIVGADMMNDPFYVDEDPGNIRRKK